MGTANSMKILVLGDAIAIMGCLAISFVGALGAIASSGDYVLAQNITLDGSLGPTGTLTGPNYVIPQSVGQTVNSNLFHSFEKFNLDRNEAAIFQSTANIRNILSRVTGGSPSLINGLIFTQSSSVNLFLINPSGIIFGPNASIDVGGASRGSFVATTADAIQFGSIAAFVASTSQTDVSLLRINPSAFLFNQLAARPITSQAPLEVYEGQSLLLVGGNVSMNGSELLAPAGRVELAGVGGQGTIGLEDDNGSLRLSFPQDIARTDVLLNGTLIDVRAGGGGSVAIYGQNLTIDNSIVVAGIRPGLGSVGTQAGDIILDATGEVKIEQASIVANAVSRGFTGNTGNINIKAKSLQLTDGAELGAFVFGQGNAGKVVVQAEDSVLLTGAGTIIDSTVAERAVGQGGEINIQTGSLILTDNAQIGAVTFGQGDAGKIFIQAKDFVSLIGRNTGILSNVGGEAVGQGGEITIQTRSLSLTDGAALTASTFGQGDAGRITVKADESISLVDGQIQSTVQEGASGRGGEISLQAGLISLSNGAFVDSSLLGKGSGGDIKIHTGSLSLTEDAALSAGTFGQGDAGNIVVLANDSISLTNSNIFTAVDSEAVGQGGKISIQTNSLSLRDASLIASTTFGQGSSGKIFVQANDSISLADTSGIASGVYSGAVGNGGDISIETRLLSLTEGSQVFAGTFGEGTSGNIQVNASDSVNLAGVALDGFSGGLFTSTEEGAGGQGGDIKVFTGSLRVSDGAVLSAITGSAFKGGSINVDANIVEATNGGQLLTTAFSSGDAGNITVNASHSITLDGSDRTFADRLAQFGLDVVDNDGPASGLFARTEGAGAAGNVTINTPQLTVKDRAQVSASTSGGTGGSITVTANSFEVTDGGQLRTSTAGSNDAGNITLKVLDGFTIAGADSGLFANTDPGSTGNGGSIFISSRSGTIRDSASVAVDSKGTGEGGNIQIQADSLNLNNRASISAETASNAGGDISLQMQDLLLMRHGSRISTTAGTAQAGGDGGNITIDTGFIVALPQENSDITANAYTGRGGNVNITAQGIYGIEFRPQLTPLSDITASSQFGVNGVVSINTPDVDPSRGLAELPVEPVNVEVTQGCQSGGTQTSVAFFNTGRGGLAPNPYEPISSSDIWEDVPPSTQRAENSASAASASASSVTPPDQLVEAQGWIVNEKGEVTLVAEMPTTRSQSRCRLR